MFGFGVNKLGLTVTEEAIAVCNRLTVFRCPILIYVAGVASVVLIAPVALLDVTTGAVLLDNEVLELIAIAVALERDAIAATTKDKLAEYIAVAMRANVNGILCAAVNVAKPEYTANAFKRLHCVGPFSPALRGGIENTNAYVFSNAAFV